MLAGLTAVSVATASCSAADQRAVVDPRPTHAADAAVPTTDPMGAPSDAPVASGTSGNRPATPPDASATPGGSNALTPMVGAKKPAPSSGARTSAGDRSAGVVPQHQAAPSPTRAPDAGAAQGTYLIECVQENLTQEPTSFTLACGDANEALDALHWERWGSPRATAEGVLFLNACEPSCAAGTLERFPVSVAASNPVKHGTGWVYTLLTVRFFGKLPQGYQRVERYPLPS